MKKLQSSWKDKDLGRAVAGEPQAPLPRTYVSLPLSFLSLSFTSFLLLSTRLTFPVFCRVVRNTRVMWVDYSSIGPLLAGRPPGSWNFGPWPDALDTYGTSSLNFVPRANKIDRRDFVIGISYAGSAEAGVRRSDQALFPRDERGSLRGPRDKYLFIRWGNQHALIQPQLPRS